MRYISINDYYGDDDDLIAERISEYNKYFNENVKKCLSELFVQQYLNFNGFHDWDVISSEVNVFAYEKNQKELIITLFNKANKITKKIFYKNIRVYKTDFNEEHFRQWSYDEYVIDEFLRLDNDYLSHEVYFPSGSSYYVEFQSIEIV